MRTLILLTLAAALLKGNAAAQSLSEVGRGYSRTSVNTAVFRQSAVITHDSTQYVAYYDEEKRIVLGKRQLGSDLWTLHATQYTGHCEDAHNVISLGIDGEGTLHVAFDHHGHKLNYCRGIAPGSLVLGEKVPMTGLDEGEVTYPEFYTLADGDLLFAYRSGASGQGNLVLNRYLTHVRQWTRLHVNHPILIDGEQRRNAYWQLCVDRAGTIHLSWVWRESWLVETNHDLCYARSRDGGKTWERSDGSRYAMPITLANAEYAVRIPQGSELINQTGMAADEAGRPYIATYWRGATDSVPQYRLVYLDPQGRWQVQTVSRRTTPFTLAGGGTKRIPIARPRIAVSGGQPGETTRVCYLFRDEERGSRVSVAETTDLTGGTAWQVRDLTAFPVDAWEPNFDPARWQRDGRIGLFVQRTAQGDGERVETLGAQPIYLLEYEPFKMTKHELEK